MRVIVCHSTPHDYLSKYQLSVLAWNYRRYVLSSMPVKRPETAELAFTTGKIEANFSNFSAWHQRTKVLASLWEKGELDEKKTKDEGIVIRLF